MDRGRWLPVERRLAHPSDAFVGRAGMVVAVVSIFLPCAFVDLLGVLLVIAVALFAGFALLTARPRRDDRAFADLGPRDEDMAEVEVRIFQDDVLLGRDQGYLWSEEGATAFQGARTAFRVGGPGWHAWWGDRGRADLLGPDGERITVRSLQAASSHPDELPLTLGGTGGFTPPPTRCDPAMSPPALPWRVLVGFVLAGGAGWAGALSGWPVVPSLTGAVVVAYSLFRLFDPVLRDRRRRGG